MYIRELNNFQYSIKLKFVGFSSTKLFIYLYYNKVENNRHIFALGDKPQLECLGNNTEYLIYSIQTNVPQINKKV